MFPSPFAATYPWTAVDFEGQQKRRPISSEWLAPLPGLNLFVSNRAACCFDSNQSICRAKIVLFNCLDML